MRRSFLNNSLVIDRHRLVIILFVVSFVIRIYRLGSYPIGITHDELNYIIAAKSFFNSFSFAPGTAPAVIPTRMAWSDVVIAEVPVVILSLLIGFLRLSLLNARIWGALMGSINVVLVFLLSEKLFKKRPLSLLSSVIFLINPWSLLMGRTLFEVNFYLFFFLAGFLVLLRTQGKKIFYSLSLFLAGFFSYTGGQVVFYLFILLALIYRYYLSRKNLSIFVAYFVVVTLIFVGYVYVVMNNQTYKTRGGELYLPNSQEVTRQVNEERIRSTQNFWNGVFINKYTVYMQGFFSKYLKAFSPDTLFLNGELRAAFSFQKHGTFYLFDLVFLIIGFAYLFKLNNKSTLFILAVIAISPITSGLSSIEYSYSQRAGLMYPFLTILIAGGVYYLFTLRVGTKVKNIIRLVVVSGYIISFVNVVYIYFNRFPIYASDGWFFQDRVLARYIDLAKKQDPERVVTVITFEPKIIFEEYLFYSGLYNSTTEVSKVNKLLNNKDFQIDGVSFVSNCDNFSGEGVIIYDEALKCIEDGSNFVRISRFRDVAAKYLIVNDALCSKYDINRYVHPVTFSNFNVESQNEQDFCMGWITKI